MFDSSSRTRVRGLVLAAVCAAALGLAACGDDDDDDATTPADAVETTETTDTGETTDAETTDTTETTEEPSETAEGDGDVADLLRSQLEAAGIQSDQADCVIDELESTLSADTLEDLRNATEAPQEVIDASTAAAQKCLQP